jgi:predicted ATPase
LFIEEMAAWMLERDGGSDDLPTTVRAMIAARLDVLPREERDVLFDASVVGKVFWMGPLASLRADDGDLDEILGSLERRDLIRMERTSAVEGDREYAFRHILIRDVAYATIPGGLDVTGMKPSLATSKRALPTRQRWPRSSRTTGERPATPNVRSRTS